MQLMNPVTKVMETLTPIKPIGYMAEYEKYGYPECCFNCTHFDNPYCQVYQDCVPVAAASQIGACPEYHADEIPF